MEPTLIILSVLVGILTLLQGWQMLQKRKNGNPGNQLNEKLDKIIAILNRVEMRLNDIWGKVK